MFAHARILPFVLGLTIGGVLFMVYKPSKEVVKQYPHPKDSSDKVFKDPAGACYKYTTHEVDCDANEGTLKDYPIQG